MAVNLPNSYKESLLSPSLTQLKIERGITWNINNIEIIQIFHDTETGVQRMVLDVFDTTTEYLHLRVYIYMEDMARSEKIETDAFNINNDTIDILVHVRSIQSIYFYDIYRYLLRNSLISSGVPPVVQTVSNYYSGVMASTGNTLLMFPMNTTSLMAKVTLLGDGATQIDELPNTNGKAITCAALHSNGKILSVPVPEVLWEYDPATGIKQEIFVAWLQPKDVMIRVANGNVVGYSSHPTFDTNIEWTTFSHDGTTYNDDTHNHPVGELLIYDGTSTMEGPILLATSEGLIKHDGPSTFVFTTIYAPPAYSVVTYSSAGNQRYAVTCAAQKSLTPDLRVRIYDGTLTLLAEIQLPATVKYDSPPLAYSTPNGDVLAYGYNGSGQGFLVLVGPQVVIPISTSAAPELYNVSRFMMGADSKVYGSTIFENVVAKVTGAAAMSGGSINDVRNKFAVNTIVNEAA